MPESIMGKVPSAFSTGDSAREKNGPSAWIFEERLSKMVLQSKRSLKVISAKFMRVKTIERSNMALGSWGRVRDWE